MEVICVQLILTREFVDPAPEYIAESRREWYVRIIDHLAWPVEPDWEYKVVKEKPVGTRNEVRLLSSVCSVIHEIPAKQKKALVLDVSSFSYCHSTKWDQLRNFWEEELNQFSYVLVIFHEYAGAKSSDSMKQLYRDMNSSNNARLTVMDRKGNLWDISQIGDKGRDYKRNIRQNLQPISANEFQKLLLTRSHRYLGHFKTERNSHIRTHYDIFPLILDRSRAYEYICTRLFSAVQEYKPDMIIAVGMGRKGLQKLIEYLGADLRLRASYCDAISKEAILREINVEAERLLILTDVVLRGGTISSVIETCAEMDKKVVYVESVIGLGNSVDMVEGQRINCCVRLKRDFYDCSENTSNCPLCTLAGTEAKLVTTENDFRERQSEDISPYDFWELMYESDAFRIGHVVSANSLNHHLAIVDTPRVLSRYGNFVAHVIHAKIVKFGTTRKPEVIFCPKEKGAVHLAYEMADRLAIRPSGVFSVERQDLEMCVPNACPPQVIKKYCSRIESEGYCRPLAIVVDDAVNTLHTLKNITNLLGALESRILYYCVFLWSLSTKEKEAFETNQDRVWYFYRLGFQSLRSNTCPCGNAKDMSLLQ